jgi:glyoxylase-like metal-dependent hydrolase (beta-lactamase superfamily II)
MEYRQYVLGDLQTNCYLLWSGEEAGVIDPGGPADELIREIESRGLKLKWVLNTHGHSDHIAGNRILHDQFGCSIIIHPADREMLLSPFANFSAFIGMPITSPDADMVLKDGDTVKLGSESLAVIETPGHTQGGIALYIPDLLFSGDTLFFESIGRTDIPGGDHRQLIKSIRERIFCLPAATIVLPGHGPITSIEHEREKNPFFHEANEIPY